MADLAAESDAKSRRDFQRLLRIFDSRLMGLVATGRLETFIAASPERQQKRMSFLQAAPIGSLRSGYTAFHRLCAAAYYGDERSWPGVGYLGPPKL
jgi:hypothetical protein